jgi:hypothetical protein
MSKRCASALVIPTSSIITKTWEKAAANLAGARRLYPDGRYSSISRRKALSYSGPPGYWGMPKVAALFEASYFAGLRNARMPEE